MREKAANGRTPRRIIVGITGASGTAIGIRLLEALEELGIERHLVISKAGEATIGLETKLKPKAVAAKSDYLYAISDIAAPIASGSSRRKMIATEP